MARSDIIANAAGLKQAIANSYSHHGPAFARAQSGEYVAQIAAVVAEIEGRDVAGNMLFRAIDAFFTKMPFEEMPGMSVAELMRSTGAAPKKPATVQAAENGAIWQTVKPKIMVAVYWWVIGVMTAKPVLGLIHWATGW